MEGRAFTFQFLFMKKLSVLLSLLALVLLPYVPCQTVKAQTHEVLITTNIGNMRVMLSDDCPRTVANFLSKVRSG